MKKFIVLVGMFLCVASISATNLRSALKEVAEQFSFSLREKSVVAIIGIYTESADLSGFMLDELTSQFIKVKKLTVADRANLEVIKQEMSFQLSGDVGDESIQQLGAMIGAETVIQGMLKQYGNVYTLTIRALNVTTAAITDMYRVDVKLTKAEIGMLEGKSKKMKRAKPASPVMIGFQNMCFGLGSYLNGHYGDGAFLTVTHSLAWIFLFSGIGCLVASPPSKENYTRYESDGLGGQKKIFDESSYKNDLSSYNSAQSIGIALTSLFVVVEIVAIIYGSVRPHYYDNGTSVIAYGDKSGFKLDLVATSKRNVAPQISYVFRY